MNKLFLSIFILFGTALRLEAQGSRPDAFANLKLWIKADSLDPGANDYSGGSRIDSAFNWGSVGGAFTQGSLESRPYFITNASPTGLPAMSFNNDGTTDDNLNQPGTSLYKFAHDGTVGVTFVCVFKIISVFGSSYSFFNNNNFSTGSNSIGATFGLYFDNRASTYITRGASGTFSFSNFTSNTFTQTATLQFYIGRIDLAGSDTSRITMNNVFQTKQVRQGTASTSNASNSAFIGNSPSNAQPAYVYIYEVIMYSDYKSDAQIADLMDHLTDKWAGADIPEVPENLEVVSTSTHQINLRWRKTATATSGYRVYRLIESPNIYSQYQLIGSPASADDTTFADTNYPLPDVDFSYRIYAYNGALYSNSSNVVTTAPAVPAGTDSLYTYLADKWGIAFSQLVPGKNWRRMLRWW